MHQCQSLLNKEIVGNPFKASQEQVCLLILSRNSGLAGKKLSWVGILLHMALVVSNIFRSYCALFVLCQKSV